MVSPFPLAGLVPWQITVESSIPPNRILRVEATSNDAPTVLSAYIAATSELIDVLTNEGSGRYRGTFSWPSNLEAIIVRSSQGGSKTEEVRMK